MSRVFSRTQTNPIATWPVVPLADVCHIQLGKMLSPKSKKGIRPVPYLRNENVQWNRFDLTDVYWMDFSEEEEEKFRLLPGDLLVCEGGEPGRSAVWQGEIERCCYQKALHRIRPRKDLLFPPFLMYRLWLSALDAEFVASHAKTTIAHLPRERLLKMRIALPPFDEQRRIAADLADQLALAAAARHAAQERVRVAESLVEAHLRETFDLGESKSWHQVAIGELTATCSGSTPPRGRREYFGGAVPWVKTGELKDGVIDTTEETVTELALERCALPRLPAGTLLVAMYGQGQTRGRTGLLACEATTNQACFAILPKPTVFSSEYLQLWFRANYGRLRSMTENRGGNQPNLNGVLLRKLQVPLPPVAVQERIASELSSRLTATQSLLALVRAELSATKALSPAVLRVAFNGGQ